MVATIGTRRDVLPVQGAQVSAALCQLLTVSADQHKRQLLDGLRRMGLLVPTTSDVNRILYASRDTFAHDDATPPRWRLIHPAGRGDAVDCLPSTSQLPRTYAGHRPRDWQTEAIQEWCRRGRRGVVEAVTGTGKTTVGVLAAASAVDAGERVLVLVPGCELLHQWHSNLQRDLREVQVGRLGDGHTDSLADHRVVVAVVHSAAKHPMLPHGVPGLLIADEVHRYGAQTFSQALDPAFQARLGLTATYTREDSGLTEHLEPYFGDVVAGCTYERGLADDILAPFRVGFVGVDFTSDEREQYDEYDERVRALKRRLIADHGCPAEPFGDFMVSVSQLRRHGSADRRAAKRARGFLTAFSKRRQLKADCHRKLEALESLAPVLASAERGLVFGETSNGAGQAAQILRRSGVLAQEFTSRMKPQARKARLADFRAGVVTVLAAPKVLDEGIDVPQADVAVIMAGSRSKRQMIQRMGRIIRPKADHRPATFIVLYVRDTAEDPANGAHEDFRDQLVDVAQDIEIFHQTAAGEDVLAWHRSGLSVASTLF